MGITRRLFLIGGAAIVGGGAAFGYWAVNRQLPNPLLDDLDPGEVSFNRYLKITPENEVWVAVPRAEMGQGVYTSLAQLVAEELDLDWDDVNVFHPPGHTSYGLVEGVLDGLPFKPFDKSWLAESTRDVVRVAAKFLGLQMTGGSSSLRDAWEPMRASAALARHALLEEAAERFGVSASELSIKGRQVFNGADALTFAELAEAAAGRDVPSHLPLKQPKDWKIIGQSVPRPDLPGKVNGTAIFGIDFELPDMVYAAAINAPAIGGKVKSVDDSASKAMRGYQATVQMDDAVAVVADSYWRSQQAALALDIAWTAPEEQINTDSLFDEYQAQLDGDEGGHAFRDDGNAQTVISEAGGNRFQATYKTPYLAHTCMEPQNCTILYKDGKAQVWAGFQVPTSVKIMVGQTLGISPNDVEANVTLLGGGFGRRLEVDLAIQAAHIAKQMEGTPIKLVWSREEDTTHDFYRPAALGQFSAALNDNGIEAIDMRIVNQPIFSGYGQRSMGMGLAGPDSTAAQGTFDQAYNISNYRMEHLDPGKNFPTGFWRSVGHSYAAFFLESFLDEIAIEQNNDPVALRRELLSHDPVAMGVVNEVARMADWQGLNEVRRGFAYHWCFGSYSAQIVDVIVDGDDVKVVKVYAAIDAGKAVNPDIMKAQIEGGIVYGLSSALMQEITVVDSAVQETNFDTFDAMRIWQMPEVDVSILENMPQPGGIGELGVPAVIPAFTNALARATGKRVRELPVTKSGFSV